MTRGAGSWAARGTRAGALLLAGIVMCIGGAAPALGQASITLKRPVSVVMIPPGQMVADGMPQTLCFVVTDEAGQLAPDANFRGSAVDTGRLSDWVQVSQGVWTAQYTVPPVSEELQVLVTTVVKVGREKVERSFPLRVVPSGGVRLAMQATPEQLIIGIDTKAVLTITAVDAAGAPADGLDLAVESSVGAVGPVQGLGGGTYRAEYTAPEGKRPVMVIVSVVDRAEPERNFGFFPLPLVGSVQWKIEVGAPLVPVGMTVGEQPFGPVVSDQAGVAMVPILVPPGARQGTAFQVDAEGNPLEPVPVDLRTPPGKRLKIATPMAYVPGNGVAGIPIYLFALGPDAQPTGDAPLQLHASDGTFISVGHLGGGIYQAVYVPPAVAAPLRVTIHASLAGSEDLDIESAFVEVVPGLPAGFHFSTEPAAVPTGSQTIQLQGQVFGTGSALPVGSGVAFAGPDGVIPMEAAVGDGRFQAPLSADFSQPIALSAEVLVPASQRPVEAVVAWPVVDQLPVSSSTSIVAMALDRFGLPVTGVMLTATVQNSTGTVSGGGPTDGFGRTVFRFDAPVLTGLAVVEVTDGIHTFTCPLWHGTNLILGFGFPLQGGRRQAAMMGVWGGLRGRLLVGAGAPPPPPPPEAATVAEAAPGTSSGEADAGAPAANWWETAGAVEATAATPEAAYAAAIRELLASGEAESRSLRSIEVVAAEGDKYDVVVHYSHAATVITVAGQQIQLSIEDWYAGWAAQIGAYSRDSGFSSQDFRLVNDDKGAALVLSTADCRTLGKLAQDKRADYVRNHARSE
jgi:hypothetical protein